MRRLIMLSLGLVLCAHTAFAQVQTDTTGTAPAVDTVAAPALVAPPPVTAPPPTTTTTTTTTQSATSTTASTSTMSTGPEQEKKGSIYVGGSIALPMSPDDFKDNWKEGFGGGGGLGYMFTPNVEVVVFGWYHSFSLDVPEGVTASGGTFTSLELMGDLKLILVSRTNPAKIRPYVVGGVGYATANISEATLSDTSGTVTVPEADESVFSYNLGVGLEFAVTPTAAIFAEGKYTILTTEGESTAYVPVRAGLKFTVF